ncbi:MAG: NUDIX hydrolase [Zoogloeaceae bacterium]|nr:NUDIX hydrolase [Zoogloeaceae bacterium]
MPQIRWKPNVTVAAVVYQDGKFLLVEEETADGLRFNQPAGHLEAGESLIDAVRRECQEETAYDFLPAALVGIYQWPRPDGEANYLRFAFAGDVAGFDPARTLDAGIVRACWLPIEELRETAPRHRSPMILRCAEDFLAGKRYPLSLLTFYG